MDPLGRPSRLRGSRVNGRGKRDGARQSDRRAEFAGGQGVQGAEAIGEFGGGEALVAVEAAEEIARGAFALLRVAFDAAGDEVAIGIAAELDPRHDVIEALLRGREPAQTVEAEATLAGVDGLAKSASLQEVEILESGAGNQWFGRVGRGVSADGGARGLGVDWTQAAGRGGANFVGQADFDEMAGFGALDQAQDPEVYEAADGFADRSTGNADGPSEPVDGEAEAWLGFEATVAEEMRVDGAVEHGEAESRSENVFHLLPDFGGIEGGVEYVVFHVDPIGEG